jgi:hypothetical protein
MSATDCAVVVYLGGLDSIHAQSLISGSMKKIAFLFLIYDEIANEQLWRNFFRKIDKTRYSIFIHWKYETTLRYFDAHKLKCPVATEYAEPSLVKAQNLLLREALKDPENERFVFLSNSCIPLKPFAFIYRTLISEELSYFNVAKDEHIYQIPRAQNELAAAFGDKNVKKASQWSILTRPIAQILAESDTYLDAIFETGKKQLADEYFYISYLHFLDKLSEIRLSKYSAVDCAMFEFWQDKEYPYSGNFTSTHPDGWSRKLKTFFDISKEEINFLLGAPCFFGRKFARGCTVDGGGLLEDYVTRYYDL